MVRWALPAAALLLVVIYASVRSPPGVVTETRFLMDTLVSVSLWGVPERDAPEAFGQAYEALEAVSREMGRVNGSPLWALNRAGGGAVSPAMGDVLEASLQWARRTRGAFDPTVAPLLDLWDILAGPHPPPNEGQVRKALEDVGWERVRYDPSGRTVDLEGTRLDLGGIAKGYAIDRAAEALRRWGADSFIVNAGGDLYVAGAKGRDPWRVGIQHPRDTGTFLRVVTPLEGALVTSGDYERAYLWEGRRIHHILDPRSGEPAAQCQSVTVWAPTAMDADALATAAFVLGPAEGLAFLEEQPGAEGMIVDAEGGVTETDGFGRMVPPRR